MSDIEQWNNNAQYRAGELVRYLIDGEEVVLSALYGDDPRNINMGEIPSNDSTAWLRLDRG